MFDFFGAIGSFIMTPLYWITSLILVTFHTLFGNVFGPASGWSWALSIVGLTLVIRAALIPLFVKQIKSSRNMQLLQPRVKELREKYGHDRERLAQETMGLYKETGTNPFASCMPLILQMPIFIALFRLLNLAADGESRGVLTTTLAQQFGRSELLGARISDTFVTAGDHWAVRGLALVLVLAMTATTFLTQRQLMSKNMPPDAMTGQYAQQQKMLLYVLPLAFGFGGIFFPVGVLMYWTTSNLWTMGQQFYVIRNNPAPGTPAATAKAERDAAKARRKGLVPEEEATDEEAGPTEERPTPPRQQPKRRSRSQRKRQTGGQQGQQPTSRPEQGKAHESDPDASGDDEDPGQAPTGTTGA